MNNKLLFEIIKMLELSLQGYNSLIMCQTPPQNQLQFHVHRFLVNLNSSAICMSQCEPISTYTHKKSH